MAKAHGRPYWFELTTPDIDGAKAFYGAVLGWQVGDSAMETMDYRLATSGEEMIAGLWNGMGGTPPNWLTYIGVDDSDATAAAITAAGGTVHIGPDDIPNTGRFAVATDPQGGWFAILQPDMSQMSPEEIAKAETTGAFDQEKPGHGSWIELHSTDPAAAWTFYESLFGWTKGEVMPMGEMGDYQMFDHDGATIGAVMSLGGAPVPNWLPYFGVGNVAGTLAAVTDAGGKVEHGPSEIPGDALIAVITDPQGAWFAVVGPKG